MKINVLLFEIVVHLWIVADQLRVCLNDAQLSLMERGRLVHIADKIIIIIRTIGNSSYSRNAPIAPFPIAILLSLTGGLGVEKSAFDI